MNISTLDKEFLEYFFQLDEPQKKSLLQMLKSFLHVSVNTERTSLEKYNKEIEEAMSRVGNGHFTTLEELEKEMESW